MNEAERFLKEKLNRERAAALAERAGRAAAPGESVRRAAAPEGGGVPPDLPPAEVPSLPDAEAGVPGCAQRTAEIGEAWKSFWEHWTFEGRASRAEYWWMFLIFFLISSALSFIGNVIGEKAFFKGLSWIFNLIAFWPGTCLIVRRLHDAGLPGGWWWLQMVSVVAIYVAVGMLCRGSGAFWGMFVFAVLVWLALQLLMLKRSDPHPNDYGPVPYAAP